MEKSRRDGGVGGGEVCYAAEPFFYSYDNKNELSGTCLTRSHLNVKT